MNSSYIAQISVSMNSMGMSLSSHKITLMNRKWQNDNSSSNVVLQVDYLLSLIYWYIHLFHLLIDLLVLLLNAMLVFITTLENEFLSQCTRGAWRHRPGRNNKETAGVRQASCDTWWCCVHPSYGGSKQIVFQSNWHIWCKLSGVTKSLVSSIHFDLSSTRWT